MPPKNQLRWNFHAEVIMKGLTLLEEALSESPLTAYHKEETPIAITESRTALIEIQNYILALEAEMDAELSLKKRA